MRLVWICIVAALLVLILAALWRVDRPNDLSHAADQHHEYSTDLEADDADPSHIDEGTDDGVSHDVDLVDKAPSELVNDKSEDDRLSLLDQPAEGARPSYHDRETSDVLRMLLSTRMGHEKGLAYLQGLVDREEIEGGLDLSEMARLMESLQLLDDKGVFSSGASTDLKNLRCTQSVCQFSVELEAFNQTPFTNAWRSGEGIGEMDFPQFYGKRDVKDPDVWHIFLARPPIDQYRDEILGKMDQPTSGN